MDRKQKMRVVVIIQARMGATRFPGKPLKTVQNRPLLSYQLERLRRAKSVDQIIVATTTKEQDTQIVELCKAENILCYRGSESDVLERYNQAAKLFKADVVVRITGDCPLIDPEIVDHAINYYLGHFPTYDYVSNSLERTYPRGLDVEVFSASMLERAAKEAKFPEEREHVTLYFYTHPNLFSLGNVRQAADKSHHRWTVDTLEDFELVTKIITALYPKDPSFTTEDILKAFEQHPDWMKINAHIKQKAIPSSDRSTT